MTVPSNKNPNPIKSKGELMDEAERAQIIKEAQKAMLKQSGEITTPGWSGAEQGTGRG